MITNQLTQYYAVNADNYDQIYADEARFDDLDDLQEMVAELFQDHKVLELGCGTAYWTDLISETAESVYATDISQEMLDLAETRGLDEDVVTFGQLDAFNLPDGMEGEYTAVFIGNLWRHVRREEQEKYLKTLRAKLGKDVLLVVLDESMVDGVTVIARTDAEGNTFEFLTADDGQRYEIMRNYMTDSTLRKRFANHAKQIRVERLQYYYLLSCKLK
ncbi:methyltransferase domain-containing protein [Duganella sp. FT80W]|uniref:Methyltransferase domain-containing protein n=1 Tax=Duganella guangzhouensis TaxID=2666084 RepID=A0A6I2L7B5_9BURK|nr:class I SAM-dependent methyltransferase [Duganella guangzhouensis]MRW93117.1 methyltransferase domain-containing protein [Duganella guangzhouensis]